MTRATTLYRMLLRVRGIAPVAPVVVAIILGICLLTALAIARVSRQHEVLRLGYQLTQRSNLVHRLREAQRQLQVERATLTSPERIKRIATSLGMTPVAPDRIRVIDTPAGERGAPEQGVRSSIDPQRNSKVARLP